MALTTESSTTWMKEHTWHVVSWQLGALRLVDSDGRLAVPARCCKVTWYQLTVVRKEVTWGLAEIFPRKHLPMAWTKGLLSVNTHVCALLRKKYIRTKRFYSGGNTQGFNFAGKPSNFVLKEFCKRPARWRCLLRRTYRVAPRPRFVADPSVTIHEVSDGRSKVIALVDVRACCAIWNLWRRLTSEQAYLVIVVPRLSIGEGRLRKNNLVEHGLKLFRIR